VKPDFHKSTLKPYLLKTLPPKVTGGRAPGVGLEFTPYAH
jgi:hypothetical protein